MTHRKTTMTINSLMIGTSSTFNQKPRFVTNNGDKNEGLLVLSMP